MIIINYKTEVESVQLGNTYIADMDKCPQDKCCMDKCCGDSCNLLYMFPGFSLTTVIVTFVYIRNISALNDLILTKL